MPPSVLPKRAPLRLEPVPRTVDMRLINHVVELTARVNAMDEDVVETKAQAILTNAALSRLELRFGTSPPATQVSQPQLAEVVQATANAMRDSFADVVEEITDRIDPEAVRIARSPAAPRFDSERARTVAKGVLDGDELAKLRKRRDDVIAVVRTVIAAVAGAGLLGLWNHVFH